MPIIVNSGKVQFRTLARRAVLDLLGPWAKVQAGTYFLNGHYVSKAPQPVAAQQETFANLLQALSREFKLVSPDEALSELGQRKSKLLCLTFDDGFQDNYTVIAPVAEQFGFRSLFFINPLYLGLKSDEAKEVLREKYRPDLQKVFLSQGEVRELSVRGHVIGSHGLSHTRLNISDAGILRKELIDAKSSIEAITGKSCEFFAYPYGGRADISQEALDLAFSNYSQVFSSTTSAGFFEFEGRVINRRHFEGEWPISHIRFFLSRRKQTD